MRLIVVMLYAVIGLSSGAGVLPEDSLIEDAGSSALFETSLPSTRPWLSSVSWSFGSKNIVTSINDSIVTDPEYKDRVIVVLLVKTGTLALRSVTVNDSGEYNVSIIPTAGDAAMTGFTSLTVYERVTVVFVNANNTNLVEFNDTVRLSCSASGSSLSFLWFNGSDEVTASDRVRITDGGATLTIASVLRYDERVYTCNVSNPVSSSKDYVQLYVSYGPENVNLTTSSSAEFYEEGSDVSLSCSADSDPEAWFKWFLNGEKLFSTGAKLNLWDIEMEQSGNYSCQAFNAITNRYTSSRPAKISVLKGPETGLSTGAIIGIAVASIVVVAGAAAGVFYMFNKSLKMEHVYESTSNTSKCNTLTQTKKTNVYTNNDDT